MHTSKTIFAMLVISMLFVSCSKKNPSGPEQKEQKIADYVTLDVSGGEPALSFPKESGGSYSSQYSNITYNTFGQVSSYHLKITFSASGNSYDIQVSGILRNSYGSTVSYMASITATIGGKVVSGTLTYP